MMININNKGECANPEAGGTMECEGLGLMFGSVESNLVIERTYAEGTLSSTPWRTGVIGGVGSDSASPLLLCTFATRLTTK